MDENGRYWFHGRFDDIIKTGGFRVGPYEVENVLMEHPAVVVDFVEVWVAGDCGSADVAGDYVHI